MPRHRNYDMRFRPVSYWPDQPPAPIAIARLEFNADLLKPAVVYARPEDGGVSYMVARGSAQPQSATPSATADPLSFAELIDMIETCVRPEPIRHLGTVEEVANMIDARSDFYPELSVWYKQTAVDWANSLRLYWAVNRIGYAFVILAAAYSLFRVNAFSIDALDALVIGLFGLSALSVVWRRTDGAALYRTSSGSSSVVLRL